MVRQDILAGLRNAVERGYSLEKAKQSFISSGYSREEVDEASQFVHSGSLNYTQQQNIEMPTPAKAAQRAILPSGKSLKSKFFSKEKTKETQPPKPISSQQISQEQSSTDNEVKKQSKISNFFKKNWKVLGLVAILVILIIILIITLIMKDTIAGWLT